MRKEYDFTLILTGIVGNENGVSDDTVNALFEAGCDDATLSLQRGVFCLEFSREAENLQEAILSAIRDVRTAKIGADVLRVDECDLVTQSEIARRMGRSKQMIAQYVSGERGKNFPAPVCNPSGRMPLWTWCAVSEWACRNNYIRREELVEAQVVAMINNLLEAARHCEENAALFDEVKKGLEVKC